MNRLKYILDYPKLQCSDCREAYAEGELADDEGKLIYNGGCPPELFRCQECPYRLYGDVDETTQKVQQIWHWVCEPLVPDQPVNLDFLFRLMNIKVGSPESREIYGRMLELNRILKEHQKLTKGDASEPEAEEQDD